MVSATSAGRSQVDANRENPPPGRVQGHRGGPSPPPRRSNIPTNDHQPAPALPLPVTIPDLRALPEQLRSLIQFLPWKAIPKTTGYRKVPLGLVRDTWQPVSSADSQHHLSLETALGVVRAGLATGIGIHLDPALRLVGLDLDSCVTGAGQLNDLATRVLTCFPGTYVELSPSRRGVHALVPGLCPPGWRRRPGMDLIVSGFLTVTGEVLRPEQDPEDQSQALAAWHAQWTPPAQSAHPRPTQGSPPGPHWSRRTADLFAELEAGGLARYPTASEADLTFVLLLLRRDPALTDDALLALVQASARMRPKWAVPSYITSTLHTARQIRARSTS